MLRGPNDEAVGELVARADELRTRGRVRDEPLAGLAVHEQADGPRGVGGHPDLVDDVPHPPHVEVVVGRQAHGGVVDRHDVGVVVDGDEVHVDEVAGMGAANAAHSPVVREARLEPVQRGFRAIPVDAVAPVAARGRGRGEPASDVAVHAHRVRAVERGLEALALLHGRVGRVARLEVGHDRAVRRALASDVLPRGAPAVDGAHLGLELGYVRWAREHPVRPSVGERTLAIDAAVDRMHGHVRAVRRVQLIHEAWYGLHGRFPPCQATLAEKNDFVNHKIIKKTPLKNNPRGVLVVEQGGVEPQSREW